jgi:transposase
LEAYLINPRSIDRDDFIEFLELLRDENPKGIIAIFMDNLSVHKTRIVT